VATLPIVISLPLHHFWTDRRVSAASAIRKLLLVDDNMGEQLRRSRR
jgi:hypothetical protein